MKLRRARVGDFRFFEASNERERASRYLKTITDSVYSGPDELLLEAWDCLLNGKPDPDVLSKFDKWSNIPEMTSANYWYTVGDLQAA